MAKKRKKSIIEDITITGLGLGAGTLGLGALGKASPVSQTITADVSTGLGRFSSVFPTVGALAGTELTIRQLGKVTKATRKLNKKRKRR